MLGIAALIALVGTPTPANALDVFHRTWSLIACTGAVAAVAGVALGRVRARHAEEQPIAAAGALAS